MKTDVEMDMESSLVDSSGNQSAYGYGYETNGTHSENYYMEMGGNLSSTTPFSIYRPRRPMVSDNLQMIIMYMRTFYTPIVIGLGVLGNTVTWIILLRSRLRSLSSSHYLAATIMVNTFYLLAYLTQWLVLFDVDLYNKPGWCQFVTFFTSGCSFLSVWYMTAFSVDRYISICWPTEAKKMCTRMRARVVIICLMCISIVVFMNTSLLVGVVTRSERQKCIPLLVWDLLVLDIIDMFINLGLPYMVVLVLTLLMACNTYKARNRRLHSDNPAQLRSVTLIFLTTCLLFHMPIELFRVIHTARRILDPYYKHKITPAILLTQRVLQDLFHTSLAAHFLLFLLCYPMFREICKTPFKWLREKTLMKFRKAPNGDINMSNVRFHVVQDEHNVITQV